MNTETMVTISINTVTHIANRVAHEVAAHHPNLSENTQAEIAAMTTTLVTQVYCAELIAARLRQFELAVYDSVSGVAGQMKATRESRS